MDRQPGSSVRRCSVIQLWCPALGTVALHKINRDVRTTAPDVAEGIAFERPENGIMKLDDTICFCFHVSKRKILNYLRINKPRRPSQLSECGGAGTGCGWCVGYLKRNFEAFQAGDLDADQAESTESHASGRATYLAEGKGKARPGT